LSVQILSLGMKPAPWPWSQERLSGPFRSLADGLVACVPLWEGGGAPIDLIQGIRGVPTSGWTTDWEVGKQGRGVAVTEPEDALGFFPVDPVYSLVGGEYLSFFVSLNVTGSEGTTPGIMGGRGTTSERGFWEFQYSTALEYLRLWFKDEGGTGRNVNWPTMDPIGNGPITLGIVYDKTNYWKLYVNGVPFEGDYQNNVPATTMDEDHPLAIGAYGVPATFDSMFGNYECAYVWKGRALTAPEMTLLHQDPFGLIRPAPEEFTYPRYLQGGGRGGIQILNPGIKPARWPWQESKLEEPFKGVAKGLRYLEPLFPGTLLETANHELEDTSIGHALMCAGANGDYAETLLHPSGVPENYPLSVATLCRLDSATAEWRAVLATGYYGSGGWNLLLHKESSYRAPFWYNQANGGDSIVANFQAPLDTWMILAIANASVTSHRFMCVGLDGIVYGDDTDTGSAPLASPAAPNINIGCSKEHAVSGWWDPWAGPISWAGVWNRTVSLEEIRAMAADPFGLIRPAAAIPVRTVSALTQTLEGFRWRDDDGNEAAATWAQVQDVSHAVGEDGTTRLRIVIQAPEGGQYQLDCAEDGTEDWFKVD